MKPSKFLIVGGDLRNLYLSDILKKEGHKVKISGFSEYKNDQGVTILNTKALTKAIAGTEVIIGPTPCCNNGINLNTPFNAKYISIIDFFDTMKEGQIFIAGRISSDVLELARERNIKIFDILEREEMAILNAIPIALPKGA